MELSRKINIYLVGVVAVAVAHAGLAVTTSLRFRADVERVANEYLPSVRSAEELEIALLEQRGYVASHLLSDGDDKWLADLRGRERSFNHWLAEARRTSFTKIEIDMLDELERLYADYVALRSEVVATYQRGEVEKAKTLLLNDLPRKHEAAYAICERYIDVNNQYADQAVADSRQHVQSQLWLTIIAVAASVLFGAVAVATFHRRVLSPLRQLSRELRPSIGDAPSGDAGIQVAATTGPADELELLGEGLRRLMRDVAATRSSLHSRQQELANAERLASVGKLAASVAHEIRNPLTAIKVWLFTLRRSVVGQPELGRSFDQISDEIHRLENVVHSFLEFARPPTPRPRAERVELLVEKAGELVQHRLREQAVKLEVSLADGLPTAWVDAEQARQVLLNLLNNALDATPSGGVVRISAAPAERSGVAMVRITVRDEGGGLTEESQRRLFEPFHTTKPHGTGLGLAIAASIMASQRGAITLEHSASDGTEFAVWIPQSSALPPEPVFANEGAME